MTLKDQYGLAFDPVTGENGEIKVTATNADKSTALAADVTATQVTDKESKAVAGSYKLTLTAGAKATTGDVDVKVDDKKVATVKVTVEAAGEVADYKLTADSTEFDLKTEDGKKAKVLTIKAVDEKGLETTEQPEVVEEAEATSGKIYYRVAKADAELATISGVNGTEVTLAKAKAGDTITVEAVKVTGAFHDVIKTLEFTVVDTTPVLKDVVFTSHPAVTEATAIDLDKILKVTAEGSKGEVKVAYTVAQDNTKALTIVEADKDGNAPEKDAVELGTVQLTNLPAGLGVTFTKSETQPQVKVTLVDQTVGGDSPQPAQNKGSFNIAVIDNDQNFKGDTTVDVNITKVVGNEESLEKIKAYGLGTDANDGKKVDDTSTVQQVAQSLDNVATFLKVQYNATLNTQNLVAKDGKLEITGPLLSAADFKKIKGDKSGAYRLTIEGVAKIAISPDGTAVFEAITQ